MRSDAARGCVLPDLLKTDSAKEMRNRVWFL